MDWIHCNSCNIQPKPNDVKFLLTNCGHIFCEKCENYENLKQCKICKIPCTVMKLNEHMIPEVKFYFEDPQDILKKTVQMLKFQETHRHKLLKYHSEFVEKYRLAKLHIRKQDSIMLKLQEQSRKLQEQNYKLQDQNRKLLNQNRKLYDFTQFLKQKYERNSQLKMNQIASASASVAKNDIFMFTPNVHDKKLFSENGSLSSAGTSIQNSERNMNQLFRKPNLNSYERYRNENQRTPLEMLSQRSSSILTSNNLRKNDSGLYVTSKFISKTPYSAFGNMKISKQRESNL